MSVVFWKELADHFSSRRFMILLIHRLLRLMGRLLNRTPIRQNTDTIPSQYAFLLLLTSSGESIFPSPAFSASSVPGRHHLGLRFDQRRICPWHTEPRALAADLSR